MTLRVERAGPLALVVDGGRRGVRHLGVTQGGAMDWISLGWANWLLGNAPDAAGIEVMVGGLSLVAEADTLLALAGADLAATVDGAPLTSGQRFTLKAGQTLAFGGPQSGLRAYLAMPGGVLADPVMGSVTSTVREGLGGLDGQGRTLQVADRLEEADRQARQASSARPGPLLEEARSTLPASGAAAGEVVASEGMAGEKNILRLDLVPGAQIHAFSGTSLFRAFEQQWQVDQRADRMGIRLTGTPLDCAMSGMVSEGIPLGAVQVPPDGQPIILMNDRQTIGGYPRLGALTPQSCARLAQCLPGAAVRLAPMSPERARHEYLQQLAMWKM
ncbi:biotin-dependent carboxyltransferase family protein [Halomonas cupida]|uniref:5-oxoprolinase subunit C family protein n=1 Tax=Halomonas cupida TaxID=44933 RepID=UPI003A8F1C7F